MVDLKTSVIVNLTGNLQRNAKRYTQALAGFSQTGARHMRRLSSVAASTGQMLDRMGNRYTGLLTGAAGIGSAKMVMALETRFTRLGIQANVGADNIARLKREIFEAAQAPEIRVDPSQITAAIEAIVEKTGDLQFARDNIANIGLAIQATGAEGGAIGEILAEFQKMGVKAPDVLKSIDLLNVQGKEGAFTLQNLAALGPRVITAYTATGRAGTQALTEMGAALQMIRMGTGSSEQAATAFEALLRTLTDPDKIKKLQQVAGIQVFDPQRLAAGEKVLRPINELMTEIVAKSKGDRTKLGAIFDAEAMRAFNQAGGEFMRTGRLDTMTKFMQVQADGKATMQDSARAAATSGAAMQNLYTSWKKFADGELSGPIQSLADALNSVEPGTVDRWMQIGKWVAIVGGGAVLARKVQKGIGGLGKAGAAAAAGGLGGMPLPLPVYVVNKHMSLTPDAWGGSPAGGTAGKAGKAGMLKRAGMGLLGRAGAVGAAGYAGWEVGSWLNKTFIEGTDLGDKIGEAVARRLAWLGNQEAKLAIEISQNGEITDVRARGRGLRPEVERAARMAGGSW
jgi:hypothetical protein